MKTIGIVGSRRRNNTKDLSIVERMFNSLYEKGDTLVSGGCPQGGDKFAEFLAAKYKVPITIHKADWKKFGRVAGFLRNSYIANDADVLIACVAPDRLGGTEDTIQKFLKSKTEDNLYLV